MTRRQNNSQWSGDIATQPAPQKMESENTRWKSSRLGFMGSRWHPPHYLPKGQTINAEYYSSLLIQLKDILKEKRPRKFDNSCTTIPRLTGNLQPRRNWPIWAYSVLITHPILRT